MTAQEYARLIGAEIDALDLILSGTDDADDIADALAVLELEHLDDHTDAPTAWMNETALDLSIMRDTRGDHYGSRIEILRTCGGPRCEITRDTRDGIAVIVSVWNGTDEAHHRMSPQHVADWLDELATY